MTSRVRFSRKIPQTQCGRFSEEQSLNLTREKGNGILLLLKEKKSRDGVKGQKKRTKETILQTKNPIIVN